MNPLYQLALSTPWAIEQSWISTILRAAEGHGDTELATKKNKTYALQMVEGKPLDGATSTVIKDGVAIISIVGPIIPRATFFSEISSITSTDLIAKAVKTAVASPSVKSIILYLDTPGGAAKYINELSEYIYSLRTGNKAIVSYVAGSCNSAGYWIGSSSSEVITDATGDLGSIGVVMAGKKIIQKAGEEEWEIVSSRAPKKRLDPTSTEGAENYLRIINSLEDVFFNTVARNMNVSIEKIAADFGQGSVLVGEHAVNAGMAHRIGSLEGLIDELSTKSNPLNRTTNMSDKNNAPQAIVVTKAYVETNHPDIAAAFKKEGVDSVDAKAIEEKAVTAERSRIAQINALGMKGFEAQVKTGIDDGLTPEAVSLSIVIAMKDRGINHDDMKKDSPAASTTNQESFEDEEDKKELAKKNGDWGAAAESVGINLK